MSGDPYIRLKQLGQGSFGRVLLVRDSRSGQLCVLKEVDLHQFGAKGKKEALKEVAFLHQLRHPYIIEYKEFFEKGGGGGGGGGGGQLVPLSRQNSDGGHGGGSHSHQNQAGGQGGQWDTGNKRMLFIIMEYADGGDLDGRIKRQKKAGGQLFPEAQVLDWFCQIVLALKHIHDRRILHRDIKAENIFLMADGQGGTRVKVGDFGISKHLNNTAAQALTRIGTPYYLSPEICMNRPYSYKSDCWALGVVLFELCTLRHPFDASSMEALLKRIVKGQHQFGPGPSKAYSPELRGLVDSLLAKDPRKRPSVNELCRLDLLRDRMERFLTPGQLRDEFSHTMIHDYIPGVVPPPALLTKEPPHMALKKKQKRPTQQQQPTTQLQPLHHQQQQQQQQQQSSYPPAAVHLPPALPANAHGYSGPGGPGGPSGPNGIRAVKKEAPILPSPFRRPPPPQQQQKSTPGGPAGHAAMQALRGPPLSPQHQQQHQQQQQHVSHSNDHYAPEPPGDTPYMDERALRKYREYEQALGVQHARERELAREREKERELQRQIAQMKARGPASFPQAQGGGGGPPLPIPSPGGGQSYAAQHHRQHSQQQQRLNPSQLAPAGVSVSSSSAGGGGPMSEPRRRKPALGAGPTPRAERERERARDTERLLQHLGDTELNDASNVVEDEVARQAAEELELAHIRAAYRLEKEARRAERLRKHEATRNHILPVGGGGGSGGSARHHDESGLAPLAQHGRAASLGRYQGTTAAEYGHHGGYAHPQQHPESHSYVLPASAYHRPPPLPQQVAFSHPPPPAYEDLSPSPYVELDLPSSYAPPHSQQYQHSLGLRPGAASRVTSNGDYDDESFEELPLPPPVTHHQQQHQQQHHYQPPRSFPPVPQVIYPSHASQGAYRAPVSQYSGGQQQQYDSGPISPAPVRAPTLGHSGFSAPSLHGQAPGLAKNRSKGGIASKPRRQPHHLSAVPSRR